MTIMIRQLVPVSVRLTGKVNRWASNDPNVQGTIGDVEVEVDAAGYECKTLWVDARKLMFPDWEDVEPEVLERMCCKEADLRAIANALLARYPGTGWSAQQLQHYKKHAMTVADIFMQVAEARGDVPADLFERVRKADKLGAMMYGVSLCSILETMDKEAKPWDETLAEVQCPPEAVDSFADAAVDAAMVDLCPLAEAGLRTLEDISEEE